MNQDGSADHKYAKLTHNNGMNTNFGQNMGIHDNSNMMPGKI